VTGVDDGADRPRWRKVLQTALSIGLVVGIFVGVLPRIADYGDVWATMRAMNWFEAGTLLIVGLVNLAAYWPVLMTVLPGLTLTQAALSNQASTAVANTLPAGGALGVGVTYAMFSSWGFSWAEIMRSVVVSGVWNTVVKLGLPVVALALLLVTADVSGAVVAASLAGVVALALTLVAFGFVLRSNPLAERLATTTERVVSRVRGWVGRPPVTGWGAAAVRFRTATVGLLAGRWKRLTVATLISHLSLYLVLLLALRQIGVSGDQISWVEVLAAFAVVRLVSALPVTPGGLGVVELGYAAVLGLGVDEATRAQIVAAVLLFRFVTYFLPIPLGAGSYLAWRGSARWGSRANG
jgi:uncharacterized protein (TIRG00374 family)